jgi:beta-lactamase class A
MAVVAVVAVVCTFAFQAHGKAMGPGHDAAVSVQKSVAAKTAGGRTARPSSTKVVRSADKTAAVKPTLDSIFAGAQYSVDVVDLANDASVVAINTDTEYTAASTYKLFVAYSMLAAVKSGSWTWQTDLGDSTLQECFSTMIINSDNDCPEAWLNSQGYNTVNDQAHQLGESQTTIGYQNMQTNAADLADFLTKLYKGSLVDADSDNLLIGDMKQQVYRDGIPSGIGDHGTVADKVGFLDGLLHDAGIVYSDKGNYVFVIMTNNSSWAAISQASSAIYSVL